MADETPKKAPKQKVAYQGPQDGLAEPGYQRNEQLKARQEALMAELELINETLTVGTISPEKLDISQVPREVRRAMDFANSEIYVSNAQPEYRYVWAYADPRRQHGNRTVRQLQVAGFEAVMGDMPEAKEHAHGPSRERFVADCILMRCRLDRYAQLKLYDREQRQRRQDGVTGELHAKAARYGVRVFDNSNMPAHIRGYMEQQGAMRRPVTSATIPNATTLRRQAARQLAMDKLAAQLKGGTVAGLTPEEAARRS